MKLLVSKAKLKEAISIASKALSKLVIQIERGHLLFKVIGNNVWISGTNNDLKALCIIPAISSEGDMSFTVDPKVLEKLISKIDSETISIDFNKDNLTLKIFTANDISSFNTIQSFPPDKMLTVINDQKKTLYCYTLNKDVLLKALQYTSKYLESTREERKRYDFIIINDKIVYAANGINKMGYFVSAAFSGIKNLKIRKQAVSSFISVLEKIEDESITLEESDNEVSIQAKMLDVYFSCLKSVVDAPVIDLSYIKIQNPIVKVNHTELLKRLARLASTRPSMINAGIEIIVSDSGDETFMDLALISNLKAKERINCKVLNDDPVKEIKRIVDYKLFNTAISLTNQEDIAIFMSNNSKFFKVIDLVRKNEKTDKDTSDEDKTIKYFTVGVGSFTKTKSS